jgi:hypothetical protein
VSLQLVHTSRIAGRVMNPDGTATNGGNVNLMPDSAAGEARKSDRTTAAGFSATGSFAIGNVPPGRYLLRARGDGDTPQFATQPLSVDGGDVGDLTVVLSAGATLTGTVAFQPGSSQVPEITQVRIGAPTTDQTAFGPQANARVDKDGRFTLSGVSTGPHLIRPNGNMRGWSLKSVTLDGRDITDTPIEVRAGQTLSNVAIVFTDKVTEVSGTITTESGTPMPDFTVLAFPTDTDAVAAAGAADHDDAPGSDGQVPHSRPAAGRLLHRDRRSDGTGRMVRSELSGCAPRRRRARHAGRR